MKAYYSVLTFVLSAQKNHLIEYAIPTTYVSVEN